MKHIDTYIIVYICIYLYTATLSRGKTFALFFQPIAKVFPLNHLLCMVHDGQGLVHRKSFPVNGVFYAQLRKFPPSKVFLSTVCTYLVCETSNRRIILFKIVKISGTVWIRMGIPPFSQDHKCSSKTLCEIVQVQVTINIIQYVVIISAPASLKCLIKHISITTNIMISPIWGNYIKPSQVIVARKWRWIPIIKWSTK